MKILIVDDEQSMGVLLGITLRRLGHVPVLALDPVDALDLLEPDVDAVITDLEMPHMNGVELARAIRERDTDIPIAFCTGSAPGDVLTQEAAAIGRVLYKVCTLAEVRDLVEHLGRRRRRMPSGSGEQQPLRDQSAARAHRRYRVHITATWHNGSQCANVVDNLSAGGLFLRNAHELRLCDRISLALALPGDVHTFGLEAEVAYVLTAQGALEYGRHPGAGLAFTETPPGFADALEAYLRRLDRRRDRLVLAADEQCRAILEEAGYRTAPAPPPFELGTALADNDVSAVLVPRNDEGVYRAIAGSRVLAFDYFDELDRIIAELDRAL